MTIEGSGRAMRAIAVAAVLLAVPLLGGRARSEGVADHLSVPGPISLNGETYLLSWSSHPSPNYYKQEYLPAGQNSEHFQSMVLIDAIVQGVDVAGAVSAQVNRLNQRKATDPIVNFALFQKPKSDEVILDFVLSADDAKGETIVEWNAYRYAVLRGGGGKSGVLLVALSQRAYGDAATAFLRGLKSARLPAIDALAKYPLPGVRPRD